MFNVWVDARSNKGTDSTSKCADGSFFDSLLPWLIAAAAVYESGWLSLQLLLLVEPFGYYLLDPLGAVVYFSYVLPIAPALLVCCGFLTVALRLIFTAN